MSTLKIYLTNDLTQAAQNIHKAFPLFAKPIDVVRLAMQKLSAEIQESGAIILPAVKEKDLNLLSKKRVEEMKKINAEFKVEKIKLTQEEIDELSYA